MGKTKNGPQPATARRALADAFGKTIFLYK